MNRASALAAFVCIGASLTAIPAFAAGLIRFHNRSFAGGLTVEVRVGDTFEAATLYGTQRLAQGDDWEVDTSGVLAWWRRELNPGKNDGQFTAWAHVDPRAADERVEL